MTNLSRAHAIIRAHEKASGKKVTDSQKIEALKEIESQSAMQAEMKMYAMFPFAARAPRADKVTVIGDSAVEIVTYASSETMKLFETVKLRLSNKISNPSFADVTTYLMTEFLKADSESTSAAASKRVNDDNKTVTPRTKKIITSQGGNKCSYRDPETGRLCESEYQVQTDHRNMQAHGGDHSAANLRPLCGVHNRLMSEKKLERRRQINGRIQDKLSV